jgi:hypothetical protein
MSRILLAWELGGSFGHISIQLPVARCLRQRGHEVLFAVKDVGTARQMLDDEDFGYVQSPLSHGQLKHLREPASFADILAGAGWSSELRTQWNAFQIPLNPPLPKGDLALRKMDANQPVILLGLNREVISI